MLECHETGGGKGGRGVKGRGGGGEGEAAGGRNREHVLDGNYSDWWRGTHGTGALEARSSCS